MKIHIGSSLQIEVAAKASNLSQLTVKPTPGNLIDVVSSVNKACGIMPETSIDFLSLDDPKIQMQDDKFRTWCVNCQELFRMRNFECPKI